MPRRTDAERAPGQKESAGYGTGALGRVGGGVKTENLTLLFFEFLLLYNVRLHFRFSPAVEVGLTLPGDAKSLRGDVLGADAAIEAADVVFMNSKVHSIFQAINISRDTIRIAWQNVIFALGIKILIMILGLMGFASMWAAVFADTGVAMICILNSIRILYKNY